MKLLNFLLFYFIYRVKALIPSSRYNGGCALVNQQIYCYGGTSDQKTTSDHYKLDLSQDFTLSSAVNSWQQVPSSSNFVSEPNSLFTMTAVNSSYIIHGGLGYGTTQQYSKNSTVLFDATNQSWKTVADNQTMPSREGSATLDQLGRIWFWGGLSDKTSSTTINRTTYHDHLNMLNTQNLTWTFPNNQTTSTQEIPSFVRPRLEHTSTLTRSGNSIYFIGGLEIAENNTIQPASMSEILEYNVINSTWSLLKTNTSLVPSTRRLHSATAIPNTDLILIYGGSETNSPRVVSDYVYLLNTTSLTWSTPSLGNSNQGAGPRFGHSAVLYKEHTLFLIFGVDTLDLARNDFFMLDIGNYQWLTDFKTSDSYPGQTTTVNSQPSSTATSSENGSTEQSSADALKMSSCLLVFMLFLLLL
ncbi:unnamed protein product [Rhizopus stolonifer]